MATNDKSIVPLPAGILPRAATRPFPACPLYLVHSISGNGVTEFRNLAILLSPTAPFFAFQIPKKARTEERGKSLRALAAAYCEELMEYHLALFGDTPYALGGWSAGAIIALDMAQRLSQREFPPTLLVAIDKCPRHTRAEIGPWNSTSRNIGLWLKRSWRNSDTWSGAVHSLLTKLVLVVRHHQLYGGPDSEYSSAQVIRNLTAHKSADERAFIKALYAETTAYVPEPYKGRTLILVTKDGYRDRVIEGWRELAEDRKVVRIPGTHKSAMLGDEVKTLAEVLREELLWLTQHQNSKGGSNERGRPGARA